MRVAKHNLCSSCLTLRLGDGMTVTEFLDSRGYESPYAQPAMTGMLAAFLEENGGCEKCVRMVRTIIESNSFLRF
jgi:hypothetical protein